MTTVPLWQMLLSHLIMHYESSLAVVAVTYLQLNIMHFFWYFVVVLVLAFGYVCALFLKPLKC